MFEIKDLHVMVDKKAAINGVSLRVKSGEIHAIMGPNGSGKSTLANAIIGHPKYAIKRGKISLGKTNLLKLSPDKRAERGLFLAFQHPHAIPGVAVSTFLRTATIAMCKAQDKKIPNKIEFDVLLEKQTRLLHIDPKFLNRDLNAGFSGGEKKKIEMLQMTILKPKLAILDEIDSGLDIDALKTVCKAINGLVSEKCGVLLITHYQRILHYVKPDFVHVMINGKIVKSGGPALGLELEKKGYKAFMN